MKFKNPNLIFSNGGTDTHTHRQAQSTFSKLGAKKICVPTLPKIFRPVTRNTLIFYLAILFDTRIVVAFHLIIMRCGHALFGEKLIVGRRFQWIISLSHAASVNDPFWFKRSVFFYNCAIHWITNIN